MERRYRQPLQIIQLTQTRPIRLDESIFGAASVFTCRSTGARRTCRAFRRPLKSSLRTVNNNFNRRWRVHAQRRVTIPQTEFVIVSSADLRQAPAASARGDPELPRYLQIDGELEFRWLIDWEVRRPPSGHRSRTPGREADASRQAGKLVEKAGSAIRQARQVRE
jgi:hypothetical protein